MLGIKPGSGSRHANHSAVLPSTAPARLFFGHQKGPRNPKVTSISTFDQFEFDQFFYGLVDQLKIRPEAASLDATMTNHRTVTERQTLINVLTVSVDNFAKPYNHILVF